MESRKMAVLLSSLISQLLLALLLIYPASSLLSLASDDPNSSDQLFTALLPLIQQFASLHEIAASLLPASRKRKRSPSQLSDPDPGRGEDLPGPIRSLDSYVSSFNMTASSFEWLSGLLDPLLDCRDPIGSPLNLSTDLRLGIGLFRLATGSNYGDISRRFGVTEAAARFCSKQLCRVLCTNFRFWVAFPGPDELGPVSKGFEAIGKLPNCCGAIVCARFGLFGNGDRSVENVAAQIVADSSSRILAIIAGFRGDKPDSRILKLSSLYEDIKAKKLLSSSPVSINGIAVSQYLVGGEEYPLLPWLMVPFADPEAGSIEENFNSVHKSMLFPVFKAVSSLRNWGILRRPMEDDLKTAVAYIGTCSILHNALLMREDYSALSLSDGVGECAGGGSREEAHDCFISEEAVEARISLAGLLKEVPCSGSGSASGGSSSSGA